MSTETDVSVTEHQTYGPNSPWSFFADHSAWALNRNADAGQRLGAHAREMTYEMQHGTPQGDAVYRQLRESYRDVEDGETRLRLDVARAYEQRVAATTGPTSLGAFVTPVYLIDQWAEFSGENRVFTDQTLQLPLPEFGTTVNVPAFIAPASAGLVAENSTVPYLDPVSTYLTDTLTAVSAEVDISQQFHDRGFNSGGSIDTVVSLQLREQLDEAINRRVLQRVFANAPTVPAASGATFNSTFYQDLASLRESVKDTAGVKTHATHLFTTYDMFNYVSRQTDASTGRPLIVPDTWPYAKPKIGTSQDDPDWGFTGVVLPGPLFWYFDDCIPAAGSNTQLLVSRPDKTLTWVGTPILRVFPQTIAGNLKIVIQLYTYVAAISRFAGANATLSSGVYPLSAK